MCVQATPAQRPHFAYAAASFTNPPHSPSYPPSIIWLPHPVILSEPCQVKEMVYTRMIALISPFHAPLPRPPLFNEYRSIRWDIWGNMLRIWCAVGHLDIIYGSTWAYGGSCLKLDEKSIWGESRYVQMVIKEMPRYLRRTLYTGKRIRERILHVWEENERKVGVAKAGSGLQAINIVFMYTICCFASDSWSFESRWSTSP